MNRYRLHTNTAKVYITFADTKWDAVKKIRKFFDGRIISVKACTKAGLN